MRVDTKTSFDFSKLKNKVKSILKSQQQSNIETFAQKARENIKSGVDTKGNSFTPITTHTRVIRQQGLSPNASRKKTSSTDPLIHTGTLLNSIRATKTGIKMRKYGTYHLKEHTTTPNKFTNWYHLKKRTKIAPAKVPARNFMPEASDIPDKSRKEIFKLLRKALRK